MRYELIHFCEIDGEAVKSYCTIHNENAGKNLGNIEEVDERNLKPFNFMVGGTPCQDFSISGARKGAVWKCKKCNTEYNPLTVNADIRKQWLKNIPNGMAPAPMPERYVVEMLMDRIAASKVYLKGKYTDQSPLEYYLSGKDAAPLHPRTKKLLERLLYMLAERGEDKTFAYINQRVLKKRGYTKKRDSKKQK